MHVCIRYEFVQVFVPLDATNTLIFERKLSIVYHG